MATDTEDDVLTPEEEEQRRRAKENDIAGSIGTPVAKPGTVTTSPLPAPAIDRSKLPIIGDMPSDRPPEMPASSPVTIAGTGAIPPYPTPEQSKAAELQQQHREHPLHGLARVADTIAGATTIGRAVEEAGRFGTYGREAAEGEQNARAAEEQGREKAAEGEQKSTADIAKTGAESTELAQRGGEEEARGKALGQTVTETLPGGITKSVPISVYKTDQGAAANLRKMGLDANGNPIPEANLAPGEKQQIALSRAKQDLAEAQADLDRFKADPNSPMYKMVQERMSLAEKRYDLALKEFGFNYEPAILSPQEQNTLPTDVSGNVVGLHSPLKPGQQTINAAQRAQNVAGQIPRLTEEIKEMAASLGPIPGRWNKFWQGDVGAADPKFAHMFDDMEFMASAVALAHAYGRLPSTISDKFDKMYQAGKQDPKNMLAAMDVAAEWMPKIVQGAETKGERGGAGGGGGGTPAAPAAGGTGNKVYVEGKDF